MLEITGLGATGLFGIRSVCEPCEFVSRFFCEIRKSLSCAPAHCKLGVSTLDVANTIMRAAMKHFAIFVLSAQFSDYLLTLTTKQASV